MPRIHWVARTGDCLCCLIDINRELLTSLFFPALFFPHELCSWMLEKAKWMEYTQKRDETNGKMSTKNTCSAIPRAKLLGWVVIWRSLSHHSSDETSVSRNIHEEQIWPVVCTSGKGETSEYRAPWALQHAPFRRMQTAERKHCGRLSNVVCTHIPEKMPLASRAGSGVAGHGGFLCCRPGSWPGQW